MERKQNCGGRQKGETGLISVEGERKIKHRTVMERKSGYIHTLFAKQILH